jgi:hypothetical protein
MTQRTKLWRRDDTVNRCEAMVTATLTGRQCKYDAEPDTDPPRCLDHLYSGEKKGHRGHHLSRFYTKALRPTLAARVEEAVAAMPPVSQLDVSEELTLIRTAASDVVEQYAIACEMPADSEKGQAARVMIGELMTSRLRGVIESCDQAAKISEVKLRVQGAFVDVMGAVITSVLKAAWQVFGDDVKVAEFERVLREHLELRSVPGQDGTELTPDQDVLGMDDTVPKEPADVDDGEAIPS